MLRMSIILTKLEVMILILMRKFLQKSSHTAVRTIFIQAQKGKMTWNRTIVTGELKALTKNFGHYDWLSQKFELDRKRLKIF